MNDTDLISKISFLLGTPVNQVVNDENVVKLLVQFRPHGSAIKIIDDGDWKSVENPYSDQERSWFLTNPPSKEYKNFLVKYFSLFLPRKDGSIMELKHDVNFWSEQLPAIEGFIAGLPLERLRESPGTWEKILPVLKNFLEVGTVMVNGVPKTNPAFDLPANNYKPAPIEIRPFTPKEAVDFLGVQVIGECGDTETIRAIEIDRIQTYDSDYSLESFAAQFRFLDGKPCGVPQVKGTSVE